MKTVKLNFRLSLRVGLFIAVSIIAASGIAHANNDVSNDVGKVDNEFRLEKKPQWEAGLAGGYVNGFDYPASRDPNVAQIVLPFFIYRSPLFRLGARGGVSAVAVEEPRLKVDLSFGGALNAESEGNSAREGLPDLDVLFEFGPRLSYRILNRYWSNGSRTELSWESKLRAVVSTDFESANARGWIALTGLRFAQRDVLGGTFDFIANLEVTAASQRFQDYLYQVDAAFATADRPVFDAKGGYLETNLFAGAAVRPVKNVRMFAGVAFGFFGGAANARSTLHETNSSTGFALGMLWTPFKSKRTISVNETE